MNPKKLILWLPAVLVLLILALVLSALLLMKTSPRGRQVVLAKVSRRLSQSTGRQIDIGDFRLHLRNFGFEFFDITVHGREPYTAAPFLQIQRLNVNIRFASALRRQLHLRKLLIDHPVVHISTGSGSASNLAEPTSNPSGGVETIFDLAVEECLVEDGIIYVNDTHAQLAGEVHNLQLRTEFNPALNSYRGLLRYSPGKIQYRDYLPVLHELETTFVMTRRNFTLEKFTLTVDKSRFFAHGSLENFDSPDVTAVYEAQLSADDLAHMLRNNLLTSGIAKVTGSLSYRSHADRSLFENVALAGDISSSALKFRLPAATTEVREVKATYKLANGSLEVHDLSAQALGGSLKADLIIHDLRGVSEAALQSRVREISFAQLQSIAQQSWGPEAHLSGKISADADATWNHAFANLVVQADVSVKGTIGHSPLTGALHSRYAANRQFELRNSYIRTPETALTLDGKVGSHSQLDIALHSSDLHELELLAANIGAALTGKPPRNFDLHGSGSLTGSVTGFVTAPRLQGKLELRSPEVAGTSWKLLRSDIDIGPSMFRLRHAALEAAKEGKINFDLYIGLNDWVYSSANPLQAEISASQIALADVLRLADLPYPVSGALSGKASLTGSGRRPLGHGEFSIADGKIFSESIESLNLGFQADEKSVHSSLVVRLPAGVAHVELTLDPETSTYQANMQADSIRLEQLNTLQQRNLPIRGAVSLRASGQGVIASPEAKATLKVSELQFEQQPIPELILEASIHKGLAEILLNSTSALTPVQGHGVIEIRPPYVADLYLDASRFSFAPLLAIYAHAYSTAIRAETELHASLRGPLQNPGQLEGHAKIEGLTVSYREFHLDAPKPIRVNYQSGILALEPASIQGTGIDLRVEATIPLNDRRKTEYLLQGTVDLGIAQMIQPDLTCTGQMQFDLDSRKHIPGSDFYGELRIKDGGLHTPAFPLGLDKTNGILNVGQRRIEIKRFEGQSGGGTVTARGGLTLRPSLQVDLGVTGKNIRLRYPEGVRVILDSNLTLAGDQQEAKLSGNVEVQRLSLTPDFDLDNLIRQFSEQELSGSPSELARHVHLEVALESASEIDVVSTQVSLQGNANLRVAGTLAEPVILGRANLMGGDLFLGGNRYVMQNGAIDFVNPLRTEPLLNVRAKTKINQYVINLNIEGPADRLNVTFTSEPPLSPLDIINLLAFGNTSEASGGDPLTTGAMGAQSALVQGLGNAVSNRVQRFAGLSYFSVNPALGSSNQNTGARVVIQHRVTSNLVVTYSADVTSTQDQAMQLEYRFNSRWSVSGVRDQNGGFGATVSFHRIF